MSSALTGWGYASGLQPTVAPDPVRPRPAHARKHIWTGGDDAWLRENAAEHSRLELMMRFDCGPDELTRHLKQLGLMARRGRPPGATGSGPGPRFTFRGK